MVAQLRVFSLTDKLLKLFSSGRSHLPCIELHSESTTGDGGHGRAVIPIRIFFSQHIQLVSLPTGPKPLQETSSISSFPIIKCYHLLLQVITGLVCV